MILLEDKRAQQLHKAEEIANRFIFVELGCANDTHYFGSNPKINIVVFVEDSESGFRFFEQFFNVCYSELCITLVSVGGTSNFRYAHAFKKDTQFDYAVFIYDRGKSSAGRLDDNNRRDIDKGVKRYKQERIGTKIKIFSPLAFESIFVSFKLLLTEFLKNYEITSSPQTALHENCVKLLEGTIEDIPYVDYIGTCSSIEQLMEDTITTLTLDTIYEITHKPSRISHCWVKECQLCDFTQDKCNVMDIQEYLTFSDKKLELLASYSVLGGLTYIMDDICGDNSRTRMKIFDTQSANRNKIIQEV